MHGTDLIKVGLTIALAGGLGCQANESAQPTVVPNASSAPKPTTAKIKGALTAAATKELWTGGGVVYLEDAPKQPNVATTATIEIHKREFSPSIAVITTGGAVTFTNRETSLTHHVFSPDIPNWDTGYLKENDSVSRRFENEGAYGLLCNIHPEMVGYVVVVPSTYFGRVSPGGEYTIADVPPGTYKITAWAPRTKPVTETVTVNLLGGPAVVDFELR